MVKIFLITCYNIQIIIYRVKYFFFLNYIELVQCGKLPLISNGTLYSTSDGAGALATLTCNSPYGVDGSLIYRCTSGGQWSGTGKCCESNRNGIELIFMY